MADKFNTIGIIGKFGDPGCHDTIARLSGFLREHGREVLLDMTTAEVLEENRLPAVERAELGRLCDLVIVIGGDGTFLNAARTLSNYDTSLLGINLGRLGFLADVAPHGMEKRLAAILDGEYIEEPRFLLYAQINCGQEDITESVAFNDVVIHKWNVARMIELDIHINGQYVNTQRSDGLIVSTPTGSTAYALSGGGPILHPELDAVVLVPICPHTMSQRPIVVDGDSYIEVVVSPHSHTDAQVTCDGQINLNLVPGDRVIIRKNRHPVRLIHPRDYDYYEILRAKLHWGFNVSA